MGASLKRNLVGDASTMPDQLKLSLILAFITVHIDLSLPVMYAQLMQTPAGCDFDRAFAVFFLISQANVIQPAICGWLTDYWGAYSHRVLFVCGVLLTGLQLLMLVSPTVGGLGALFLVRGLLINQALDQGLKALASRAEVTLECEDRREREIQRSGTAADVITSVIEVAAMGIALALPEREGAMVVLGFSAVAAAGLAAVSLTFAPGSFDAPDEDAGTDLDAAAAAAPAGGAGVPSHAATGTPAGAAGDSSAVGGAYSAPPDPARLSDSGGGSATAPTAGSRGGGGRLGCCCAYLSRGCRALLAPKALGPLVVYAVTSTAGVVVLYPLAISEARETGAPAGGEAAAAAGSNGGGECVGLLGSLFQQRLVGAALYLAGGAAYSALVAGMAPSRFYGRLLPAAGLLLACVAATALIPGRSATVSAATLAVLDVSVYYAGQFGTWLVAASVPSAVYGFVQMVVGVMLALEGVAAAGLLDTLRIEHAPLVLMVVALLLLAAVAGLQTSCVVISAAEAEGAAAGVSAGGTSRRGGGDDGGEGGLLGRPPEGPDGPMSRRRVTGRRGGAAAADAAGRAGRATSDSSGPADVGWGGLELAALPQLEQDAGTAEGIRAAFEGEGAARSTLGVAETAEEGGARGARSHSGYDGVGF
ncbi:hypothetical protein FNF29_07981 [Cafeteria roenbergensis]|uniref:Uncharacterized protein n=1 Tax=Cafeteria roenbergensis TaxID=33653 RepID=A0A5A8C1E7_CAFRO|nr:hypothetical protein FNF29_07981 [Cafeteria roenbergensis]|eukprot:KAA0146574.1 hypothetical protein FNF29_07981 [Cafeteria roenbergensis]